MKNLIAFLSFITVFYACDNETVVSEINGVIYTNCSYSPLAFGEVALKVNPGQSFSEPLIIGGDAADANGIFKFTYELEENEKGKADLILVQSTGFQTLVSNLQLSKDYNLSLFKDNTASVQINLSGTRSFAMNDTLFMGLSTNDDESFVVQPNQGIIDTLRSLALNPIISQSSSVLYYGIGSTDFQKAKEALSIQDSSYNHMSLNLTGCNQMDLVDLVIN